MENVAKKLVANDSKGIFGYVSDFMVGDPTHVIQHAAVDFQDTAFSEAIRQKLRSRNIDQYCSDEYFNDLALNRFINGMHDMCQRANADFMDYTILKDLIDH